MGIYIHVEAYTSPNCKCLECGNYRIPAAVQHYISVSHCFHYHLMTLSSESTHGAPPPEKLIYLTCHVNNG